MIQPYPEEHTNTLYDYLFCDSLEIIRKKASPPSGFPWDILFSRTPDEQALLRLIRDPEMESRIRLLACTALRENQLPLPRKELLGVIVELGLEQGLDVLAAYRDGTARYINYTGSVLMWESPDTTSRQMTETLFTASEKIIDQIGPWDKPRRVFPGPGNLRISFLVTDGLHFGEGPAQTLFNDPFSAPALSAATAVMQYITRKK